MSSYHMSMDHSRSYVDAVLDFQPRILTAFPSTAFLLARFFRNHNVHYTFDAVFTSSEALEPYMREEIERTFNTRVCDWYGQAERVASLGQCRYGTYHIQEDYSFVELVDCEHGLEIVGTHLHNYSMPLLRYRTHDYVMEAEAPCPCGHAFRGVEQIVGRSPGFLLTPEGAPVFCAPAFVFRAVENVLEGQFYKERPGEVTIRVITKTPLTMEEKAALRASTLEYTSPHMRVLFEEVAHIARGPNGKFQSVVNTCATLREAIRSVQVLPAKTLTGASS